MKKHQDYSVTDISEFHDLIQQTEQKLGHELYILPIPENPFCLTPQEQKYWNQHYDTAVTGINQIRALRAIQYGELGWTLYDLEVYVDFPELSKAMGLLAEAIEIEHRRPTLDNRLAQLFTKPVVNHIVTKTKSMLTPSDQDKFNRAFADYTQGRHIQCATMLASIIDSQNIKFMLNANLQAPNTYPNIQQGWDAFAKIIQHHYGQYFDIEVSETRNNQRDKFKAKMKALSNANDLDENLFRAANIAAAMMVLFTNTNWIEYQQRTLPASINRNWLAHGMYDVQDVNAADCIKLFVLLYQTQLLLSDLKNGIGPQSLGLSPVFMQLDEPPFIKI